jgi:hypothetical protein
LIAEPLIDDPLDTLIVAGGGTREAGRCRYNAPNASVSTISS